MNPTYPEYSGSLQGLYTITQSTSASADVRTYTVTLDNIGEPTMITYPSGGYTSYSYQAYSLGPYQGDSNGDTQCTNYTGSLVASKSSCTSNSGICSTLNTTTYTPTFLSGDALSTMTVHDPPDSTGKSPYTVHHFNTTSNSRLESTIGKFEIQAQRYSSSGSLLRTTQTQYSGYGDTTSTFSSWDLPVSKTTTFNDVSPVLVSQVQTDYDTVLLTTPPIICSTPMCTATVSINNPVEERLYDFGGILIKKTDPSWEKTGIYSISANHILDHVSTQTETDLITGNTRSTVYGYDAYGSLNSETVNGTGVPSATTTYIPNSHGQVTQTTDPKNNITKYSYAGAWADSDCNTPSSTANGPATITDALGHVTTYSYFSCSGEVASVKDANHNITTATYDGMGRTAQINYPDGGRTSFSYVDAAPESTTKTTLINSVGASESLVTQTLFDGLGRVLNAQILSNPVCPVISKDYVYDSMGNVASTSNPYCLSQASATDGVTKYQYDNLERKTAEIEPDGVTKRTWSYSGNSVLQSDESGNQRKEVTDGLGRLIQVFEPNGVSKSPSMETDYAYNGQSDLLSVTQWGGTKNSAGARTRSFAYDGLSRLLAASNPESRNQSGVATQTCAGATGTWTNCYTYDADSNVASKSDNRGVTTSYSYNPINQVLTKTYNDGVTPSVSNTYDAFTAWGQPRTNTVGRLVRTYTCGTNMSISGGSCEDDTYSYDSMGRINHIEGATPSQDGHAGYWVQPQYDLAGDMTSLTYPDGRVVNQTWNSAGQLSQVADGNGYQYMTSQSTYWPNGAPQAIWYGNGVANGYHMNNRLQVDEIGNIRVGTSAPGGYSGGTSLTTKHYCFGPATPPLSSTIAACPTLASANNGNIWQAQDSLNSARTQNFTYDTLNRIKTFATANNSASQTFTIDAWGNLSQSGTLSSGLTFDANNKITSGGVAYDAAGNEIAVNNGVSTVNYTYDADGHILTAANGSAKYFYSSEGNRVRKDMGSTNWTEYIYLGGQVLSELSSDGTWSDYVYGNGQRMARADKYDIRLHLSGTNCSNCGTNPNMFTGTTSLTAANGYTIRNGDVLSWRQYQSGSTTGGLYPFFTDGTDGLAARDADGQLIDQDQTMNSWHMRTVNLSAYAGKTIQLLDPFQWTSAPAGSWNIYYGDITLTSTDGSAIPIYSRTMMTLSLNTNSNVSSAQAITEKVADTNPLTTTTFYHGDQIGSARLMTASGGWPVWSDTFYPFGQETSSVSATNHYKFTGKERDTESGNDYFGARYYASGMGRFMSPDRPIDQHKEDPQSMNLYSYVRNRPLTSTDPTGNFDCTGGAKFCFDAEMAAFKLREASVDINNSNLFALQGISDVLGTYGDHNGVEVKSADLGGTDNSHVAAETRDKSIIFNSRFDQSQGQMAVILIHEGSHVQQNEIADKFTRNWLGGLFSPSSLFAMKPSWSGLMRREAEAYTNQGYMEQALHMKGQIYDPSDVGPGAQGRRDSRINSSARGSVNSDQECGSGSVGEAGSKCAE